MEFPFGQHGKNAVNEDNSFYFKHIEGADELISTLENAPLTMDKRVELMQELSQKLHFVFQQQP